MNNTIKIACFDVYYFKDYAQACSIVFQIAPSEKIISKYCTVVKTFDAYMPGEFYKRELPCLLQVYARVKEKINIIIIDGYVLLGDGRKGLGAYFYEALDKKIPVIGVAKTYFHSCVSCIKVYRGKSTKPLYVSSMGIDLCFSAKLIGNLQGKHRIPEVLKAVDRLSREKKREAIS
ncbi:MAG: endonuclease V [Firmicutes bacterium]|nr:endonuclease V [Bacillota bacterium]